jgi:DNA-binding beta-propeller fold protein YncE
MPDLPHQVAGGPAGGQRRRELLLGIGASALLASCAVAPPKDAAQEDEGDRLWPMPPELPRFAYETSLRSLADVLEITEEARMRYLLTGTKVPDGNLLEKPSMVAARDGRVFVADSVRRSIIVFDAPRRKVFQFGLRAPATLSKPTAIALDRSGRVYVADATLRRVFVYDNLGLHQLTVGQPSQLQKPTGVAASPDGKRIYVIDRADNESDLHRVLVYDGEGKLLQEIGRRGSSDGEFNVPVQAVVSPDGKLHVLDAGNFRIQTFDAEGRFLRSFGKVGTGLGQFARPRALACDDEGRLYVTDGAFGNVQIFSETGELLLAIGRGSKRDLPGRYGVIMGVAVDNSGRIYLVDQLFNKVEVIRRVSEQEGRALVAKQAKAA